MLSGRRVARPWGSLWRANVVDCDWFLGCEFDVQVQVVARLSLIELLLLVCFPVCGALSVSASWAS